MKKIVLLGLCLLFATMVLGANDPGHDTLYVEENGSSEITGDLNISQDLRVAQRMYADYLEVRGDGTVTGTNRIIGSNGFMQIESTGSGVVYLFKDVAGEVRVGTPSQSSTLNVSGTIYQDNVRVCLANGTDCLSGNNSGNVSSIIAGNGISVSGATGDVTVSASAATCAGDEYSYWSGTAWLCRTDQNSGGTGDITAVGDDTTGEAFTSGDPGGQLYFSDLGWLGLGSSEAIIQFDDEAGTDTVRIRNAKVTIGAQAGNDWGILSIYDHNDLERTLGLHDPNLTHPFSGSILNSGFGSMGPWDGNGAGGLRIKGFSDNDNRSLVIEGYVGSTSPSSTTPAVMIRGLKSSGGSGSTAMVNDELVLNVDDELVVKASGNVGIGVAEPAELLEVAGNINSTGGDICITGGNCLSTAGGTDDQTLQEVTTQGTTTTDAVTIDSDGSEQTNIGGTLYVNGSANGERVGIGTSSALKRMEVTGVDSTHDGIRISSPVAPSLYLADTGETAPAGRFRISSVNNVFLIGRSTSGEFSTVSGDFSLDSSGNTGINTTTPQNTLEVVGTINATAIKVGTVDVCQSDGTNCPAGSGNVSGTGVSTDNAIARWNGAGGDTIQNSGITIDDNDDITGVADLTLAGNISMLATRFHIGYGTTAATGVNSVAVGINTIASGTRGITLGMSPSASSNDAIAIGTSADAAGQSSIALGANALTNDAGSIAIGANANTSSTTAPTIAIGQNSLASENGALAVGDSAQATDNSGVAIGRDALAIGNGAVALGYLTNATGVQALALGYNNDATATNSIAIGEAANAAYTESVALGYNAQTTAVNQFMVGASGDNLNTYIHGTLESTGVATFASTANPGTIVGSGGTGYLQVGGSIISDAGGNLVLNSDSLQVEITDDLKIMGNDIQDSSETVRISLGAANAITGALTVSDNTTVDGSVFHADATNNKVGVGTANPVAKFEVSGATNFTNGNVSVESTYSLCFDEACTSRIYHNGTALIIEGQ